MLVMFAVQEVVDKLGGGVKSVRWRKLQRGGGVEVFEVVGIVVGELYESFVVAAFVSLTWLASSGIQVLIDDVQSYRPILQGDVALRVRKWKRSYFLTLDLIEGLDQFFGPTLCVFISRQFIMFTIYTFSIPVLWIKKERVSHFSICYLTRNIILMVMLVAATQRMKKKVILDSLISNVWKLIKSSIMLSNECWMLVSGFATILSVEYAAVFRQGYPIRRKVTNL